MAFADDEAGGATEATPSAIGAGSARRGGLRGRHAVVNDVPLLVESQKAAERGYEVVIVVEAPRAVRLERLETRGLTRADAEARMAAQATDEERRAVATHLLHNGGTPKELAAQVDDLWADLQRLLEEKDSSSGK